MVQILLAWVAKAPEKTPSRRLPLHFVAYGATAEGQKRGFDHKEFKDISHCW